MAVCHWSFCLTLSFALTGVPYLCNLLAHTLCISCPPCFVLLPCDGNPFPSYWFQGLLSNPVSTQRSPSSAWLPWQHLGNLTGLSLSPSSLFLARLWHIFGARVVCGIFSSQLFILKWISTHCTQHRVPSLLSLFLTCDGPFLAFPHLADDLCLRIRLDICSFVLNSCPSEPFASAPPFGQDVWFSQSMAKCVSKLAPFEACHRSRHWWRPFGEIWAPHRDNAYVCVLRLYFEWTCCMQHTWH